MTNRHSKRYLAYMKYKLYDKVLSRKAYPSFLAMVNAGIEATLPTALSSVQLPTGFNTDYGIAWASLLLMLFNALTNFLQFQLQTFNAQISTILPPSLQTQYNEITINDVNGIQQLYDQFVKTCKYLYVPAKFDETYFDLSLFNPDYLTNLYPSGCKKLQQYFSTLMSQSNNQNNYIDITSLNTGKTTTSLPPELNTPSSGINNALNQLGINYQDLPDLAQYILSFLNALNSTLSSGCALDACWLDRSELSIDFQNAQLLGNSVIIQYLPQFLGIVLDYSLLDLNPLVPSLPTLAQSLFSQINLPYIDIVAIVTAEKFLISLFGQLFAQHFYDPSPGGVSVSYSLPAESYIENYDLFMRIQQIVNRRYSNIWYAKMIASIVIEVARYPYQQSYSYNAGKRTLSYQDFLNYVRTIWSFYGVAPQDIEYAIKLGEQFQGMAKVQNELKKITKSTQLQQYKIQFYYQNFKNIANR